MKSGLDKLIQFFCCIGDISRFRPAMTTSAEPDPTSASHERFRSGTGIEWPTVALAIVIYGGWFAVTASYVHLPLWLSLPLGAWFVCWQSSLQHEVLHGHPTRWRKVNRLLGMPPLMFWLPYERYRQTHLIHHIDERLTDPLDDPETNYWTKDGLKVIGPLGRLTVAVTTTLLGRILVSPFWAIGRFLIDEVKRVVSNKPGARMIWAEHTLWCVPVLLWIVWFCEIPLLIYLFGMVVPATSLMLIRSYAEHRAAADEKQRTAVVENAWILGPLYLFNNYHAMHHEQPTLPWYKLPAWYRANRDRLVQQNGGLIYRSYFDIARRYLVKAHDTAEHPLGRIPRASSPEVDKATF
jgi:fatty acid desaturase